MYKVRRTKSNGKNKARRTRGEQGKGDNDLNPDCGGEPQRYGGDSGHKSLGIGGSNWSGENESGFHDEADAGKILEQVIDEIAAELKETRSKEARLAIRLAELQGLRDQLAEITEDPS